MGNVSIETELKKHEKISISSYVDYEPIPPFCFLGTNDTVSYTGVPGYPQLFDVFSELPQYGHWLFWTLAKHRKMATNMAYFTPQNKNEEKRISKGYKALNDLQLAYRIQRGQYMINPKVLFPKKGHFQKVLDPWMTMTAQLKGELS